LTGSSPNTSTTTDTGPTILRMSHSRTEHDLFQDFKQNHNRLGYRYRDYVANLWERLLDDYELRKWHLIRIAHNGKQPAAGTRWAAEPLGYSEAPEYLREGENLAVMAGNQLVIVDCDRPNIDRLSQMIMQTRTCRTPRGWHFYTRTPFDVRAWKRLKKHYPFLDNPRTNIMYALVPISKVFLKEERQNKGPARLYEWMNLYDPLSFTEFVKKAVKC